MIVKQQVLRYRTAGGKAGIENGQQIFGDQFGESLRSFVRACRISFAPCQRQRYFFQSELLVALWPLSLLDFEKKKKKKKKKKKRVTRTCCAIECRCAVDRVADAAIRLRSRNFATETKQVVMQCERQTDGEAPYMARSAGGSDSA
jgi:hypothetical protein